MAADNPYQPPVFDEGGMRANASPEIDFPISPEDLKKAKAVIKEGDQFLGGDLGDDLLFGTGNLAPGSVVLCPLLAMEVFGSQVPRVSQFQFRPRQFARQVPEGQAEASDLHGDRFGHCSSSSSSLPSFS